jgi:hypothetical protein
MSEIEHRDRTVEQANDYYGSVMVSAMFKTGFLDGITCIKNDAGELVIYSVDWERAYNKVTRNIDGEWD